MGGTKARPIADRLLAKANKNGPVARPELGPCWMWIGSRNPQGYGHIKTGSRLTKAKTELAHRVAWELERGVIPEGLCVCHKCDNPSCVRVEHMFLGTRADNNHDMDAKGRRVTLAPKGERHGAARLTERDVELMRLAYETLPVSQLDIANAWGISKVGAHAVLRYQTWRHVA